MIKLAKVCARTNKYQENNPYFFLAEIYQTILYKANMNWNFTNIQIDRFMKPHLIFIASELWKQGFYCEERNKHGKPCLYIEWSGEHCTQMN